MKKLILITAVMIAGTLLRAQEPAGAVPGSQLREQYCSEENRKQIQAIQSIKEDARKNKVLTQESESEKAEVEPEQKPESSASDASKGEKPIKKIAGHKFGPGITKTSSSGENVESLGVSPMRMLGAIVILILAMGTFFFFLKKFSGKITGSDNNASLRVKARLQLDNKNSVVIVGAYEQEFMLGVGSNGVTLISKFAPIDIGEVEEEAGVRIELSDSNVEKDDSSDVAKNSFEKRLKMVVGGVDSEDLNSLGDK